MSDAENLLCVGYGAFYGCGGSVVYLPDRQNLNSFGNKNDVIWYGMGNASGNGVPELIITPNMNAY